MRARAAAVGAVAIAVQLIGLAARADETKIRLADSPDTVLVRARCSICHSLDYIPMNSRFLNRGGWDAVVHKMMKVMGAPITDDEATRIIDYLNQHYGAAP